MVKGTLVAATTALLIAVPSTKADAPEPMAPLTVTTEPQSKRAKAVPPRPVVKKVSRAAVRSAPPKPRQVSSKGNRALGQRMAAEVGWTGSQWACLEALWTRESNWRTTADNPNSSAYGIPQALPGSKMGPGWQTDPVVQIRWGLSYLRARYGDPCGGWSHFQRHGWY